MEEDAVNLSTDKLNALEVRVNKKYVTDTKEVVDNY